MKKTFRYIFLMVTMVLAGLSASAKTVYYVTCGADGTHDGTQDGLTWAKAMTLEEALAKAQPGDEIWLKGYADLGGDNKDQNVYIPTDKQKGFVLPSGVSLYGGFQGLTAADGSASETTSGRETFGGRLSHLRYHTVLWGDMLKNDTVSTDNLLFNENSLRSDNARHVVTMDLTTANNTGKTATILDGVTIAGGHAYDADASSEAAMGGGVYVKGRSGYTFQIRQCFFINNYARCGAAIYVDKNADQQASLIKYCSLFNNVAGDKGASQNKGAGVYIANNGSGDTGGAATIVNCHIYNNVNGGLALTTGTLVVNCTIARNSGAGVDGNTPTAQPTVYNTVVWGNTDTWKDAEPDFHYCAHPNFTGTGTDANGNRGISKYNREMSTTGNSGPFFVSPSGLTGYDRTYSWHLNNYPQWQWNTEVNSSLINTGNKDIYNSATYGSMDVGGYTRLSGSSIDIGACEYEEPLDGNIQYVKEGGVGQGTSWDDARGYVQDAINALATKTGKREVWIAGSVDGTVYTPKYNLNSTSSPLAFKMVEGVDVYGGFKGEEKSKNEREMDGDMPWEFKYKVILRGSGYTGNSWSNNSWSVAGSGSTHVVWFAPLPSSGSQAFATQTYLDGVIIEGGSSTSSNSSEDTEFAPYTSRGAGVYMAGNAILQNAIVRNSSSATTDGIGGGVFLMGGRLQNSLVYNCNATKNGGGVFVHQNGTVLRCQISNNSATNGAGVYLNQTNLSTLSSSSSSPEALVLSSSVITNNTGVANAAVYCNKGGVIEQCTVANNYNVRSTDATEKNASRTAGIYMDSYGIVVNTVAWNNGMKDYASSAQMYALNPSKAKVRFFNNAFSSTNALVWNNIYQSNTISITSDVDKIFAANASTQMASDDALNSLVGVQGSWTDINYHWNAVEGSILHAQGLPLGSTPGEVTVLPELDIDGDLFDEKPSIGAQEAGGVPIVPELTTGTGHNVLRIYITPLAEDAGPGHDGSSWAKEMPSCNEALTTISGWKLGDQLTVYNPTTQAQTTHTLATGDEIEIWIREGNLYPRYTIVNADPQSATILVQPTAVPLTLYGGFAARTTDESPTMANRSPLTYRGTFDGNPNEGDMSEAYYHVVTIDEGCTQRVALDGFIIANGCASGTATIHYGAGMLVEKNSNVELRNCIFENNAAMGGAAIAAPESGCSVSLVNCVVNNNSNEATSSTQDIIYIGDGSTLSLNHVTVVNNEGKAPAASYMATSFAAGNLVDDKTDGANNTLDLATVGADGAANFENPTNQVGATQQNLTYYGTASSFRPLTSSSAAGNIINQAATTSADLAADISSMARNLGGAPDLGAYEAELPESGSVLYVRGTDGNDSNDGLSWGKAFKTLDHALTVAAQTTTVANRPDIWVAQGTYTHKSSDKILDQYYAYKFVDGVNVYGGFPNTGNPGKDDRQPKDYETILQPGSSEPSTMLGQASYGRVLVQESDLTTETAYDGFTLQHGYLFSCYRQDIKGDISQVKTDLIGLTGGAGAYLMKNGVIENCVVKDNYVYVDPSSSVMTMTNGTSGGYHQAAAGVYCAGGTIKNCVISENVLRHKLHNTANSTWESLKNYTQSVWMYGAGLYMYDGNVYNTVISKNVGNIITGNVSKGYFAVICGAGAFLYNGNFYNNTITENESQTVNTWYPRNISNAGVYVYNNMKMYNCIVSGNIENKTQVTTDQGSSMKGDIVIGYPILSFSISGTGQNAIYTPNGNLFTAKYSCIEINSDDSKNLAKTNDPDNTNIYQSPSLADDYTLQTGSVCINAGTENIPNVTIPSIDAAYTDRVKDCTIDIGAYESDNVNAIAPDANNVYYVTFNGHGDASARDSLNPACAAKLQDVLYAAGKRVKELYAQYDQITDSIQRNTAKALLSVKVKVAGYESNSTYYPAYKLSDPNDPQSYTFVIPEGVTVMGGYNEGIFDDNAGTVSGSNWGDDYRDITARRTIFRAVNSTNDVQGRHVLTFKSAKEADKDTEAQRSTPSGTDPLLNYTYQYYSHYDDGSVATNQTAMMTIVDGIVLEGGNATTNDGTKGWGGAAILPSFAHVRNCVARNNEAVYGGAFYMLPGGSLVSGTLVRNNTASYGGGIYANNGGKSEEDAKKAAYRAYIASCTIVANEASQMGGGVYHEAGSAVAANTIVWGNSAASDKNISGIFDEKYTDIYIRFFTGEGTYTSDIYPYNACFVESYDVPGIVHNNSMTSDLETYFEGTNYIPLPYSTLVHNGISNNYQTAFQTGYQVADHDLRGTVRIVESATNCLTAGCYAVHSPDIKFTEEALITRLFVSQNGGQDVDDATLSANYGRSFYTPFNSVGAALSYIRKARTTLIESKYQGAGGPLADETTHFEILISEGTYKPEIRRTNATIYYDDQRLNSFSIPVNTSIYASFASTEKYANNITSITLKNGETITLTDVGDNTTKKKADGSDYLTMHDVMQPGNMEDNRTFSDFNSNGILEPWELKNQTVFSGAINASTTEENVYHVVYTSNVMETLQKDEAGQWAKVEKTITNKDHAKISIDGVTIMDGKTLEQVECKDDVPNNEIGHGGGIYSYGVDVTLNRARVLTNKGVHGGGIFVYDGNLTLVKTILGGNEAMPQAAVMPIDDDPATKDDPDDEPTTDPYFSEGGAVCVAGTSKIAASECIFANNSADLGGAIYTEGGNQVDIVNSLIVRNSDTYGGSVYCNGTDYSKLKAVNTVIWGNEGETQGSKFNYSTITDYCASDLENFDETVTTNVQLSTENMSLRGPRFRNPSTECGPDGYSGSHQWDPAAISLLTDAGTGAIEYKDGKAVNTSYSGSVKPNNDGTGYATGVFEDWFGYNGVTNYQGERVYFDAADGTAGTEYYRYMGPHDEYDRQMSKKIDIGFYEFQYNFKFGDLEKVYIATQDAGKADGSSWENASSDLRGAIMALSAATGNSSTKLETLDRTVFVHTGEYQYMSPVLMGEGEAKDEYLFNVNENSDFVKRFTIRGSCTGVAGKDSTQDYTKPTVIVATNKKVQNLLVGITGSKPVTIDGLEFNNENASTSTIPTAGFKYQATHDGGSFTLSHCSFRLSGGNGIVEDASNKGKLLVYNTLFADNKGNGMVVENPSQTTIVNATFANNSGADVSKAVSNVYNTASWKNGTTNITDDTEGTGNANRSWTASTTVANNSVNYGPNFIDPDNTDVTARSYHIRPSLALLGRGKNSYYINNVLGTGKTDDDIAADRDLANLTRLVDGVIDIGAYEYNAKLRQILYVKNVAVAGDGSSWNSPLNDLQAAIDLAGLDANSSTVLTTGGDKGKTHQESKGYYGYVYVDSAYSAKDIVVSLPKSKVFGSFGNEHSGQGDDYDKATDLPQMRHGVLEANGMSHITNLTINTEKSVIDGFEVNGNITIDYGILSTSVVRGVPTTSTKNKGYLYNSLVLAKNDAGASVSDNIRTVNVTAIGSLPTDDTNKNCANNRPSVGSDGLNKYLKGTSYWEYQLNETDHDCINQVPYGGSKDARYSLWEDCVDLVLHDRDLAGNRRFRDSLDYGCFETWDICQNASTVATGKDYHYYGSGQTGTINVTADDYPHGKSVVYVRKNLELHLDPELATSKYTSFANGNCFTPGYLLLEHRAGLRGRGSYVYLDNFGVERDLKAGEPQMLVMPYSVGTIDNWDTSVDHYYRYDGDARSKYDYKFSSTDGAAWTESSFVGVARYTQGLMFISSADKTIRFNVEAGYTYTEDGTDMSVVLTQYNHQDQWTTDDDGSINPSGSNRFTHKENMGWNLFGSPYLCSMNYADMQYGRVMYGYVNGKFEPISTEKQTDDGIAIEGYIPAGEGVFTQTATLASDNCETFSVDHLNAVRKTGEAYGNYGTRVALTRAATTRSEAGGSQDELLFNAVPADQAHSDYVLGEDGVKWMAADSVPQVYAVQNGGRYSLLSAVSEDGTMHVGVTLPEAGAYTFSIPEDCPTDGYEAIMLKDAQTGYAVDLLTNDYDFSTTEAGDVTTRFSITFRRGTDNAATGITIRQQARGQIRVTGTEQGDIVRVYSPAGVLANEKVSTGYDLTMPTRLTGPVLIEVSRANKPVVVKKMAVK